MSIGFRNWLLDAIRARVNELQVSGEALDSFSGMPRGYYSKIARANPIRRPRYGELRSDPEQLRPEVPVYRRSGSYSATQESRRAAQFEFRACRTKHRFHRAIFQKDRPSWCTSARRQLDQRATTGMGAPCGNRAVAQSPPMKHHRSNRRGRPFNDDTAILLRARRLLLSTHRIVAPGKGRSPRYALGRSQPLIIILSLSFYAAILEIAQIWVPGRNPTVIDFAASSAGALIGAALVWTGLRATTRWLAERPARESAYGFRKTREDCEWGGEKSQKDSGR